VFKKRELFNYIKENLFVTSKTKDQIRAQWINYKQIVQGYTTKGEIDSLSDNVKIWIDG